MRHLFEHKSINESGAIGNLFEQPNQFKKVVDFMVSLVGGKIQKDSPCLSFCNFIEYRSEKNSLYNKTFKQLKDNKSFPCSMLYHLFGPGSGTDLEDTNVTDFCQYIRNGGEMPSGLNDNRNTFVCDKTKPGCGLIGWDEAYQTNIAVIENKKGIMYILNGANGYYIAIENDSAVVKEEVLNDLYGDNVSFDSKWAVSLTDRDSLAADALFDFSE